MSRLGLRIVIASLSAGLLFDITAQEKPTKSALTDLGIEVVDRDYVIPFRVPRNEEGYLQIRAPAALPDWRQSDDSVPLTDIRIRSVAEEDGVRLKIGAIFDDSDKEIVPAPTILPEVVNELKSVAFVDLQV